MIRNSLTAIALWMTMIPTTALAGPINPQIFEQRARQLQPQALKLFSQTVTKGERGKLVAVNGWRLIRTGAELGSAVGINDKTGIFGVFEARAQGDRLILMQLWEPICPKDIAAEPRWKGAKPELGIMAAMVFEGQKSQLVLPKEAITFEAGSAPDKLICDRK
jgi:hypothetical protein